MAGRKSVYETKVKSRFDEIKIWLEKGVTERSISEKLGIAYSTFNKYKSEKTEFSELLKINREKCVDDIENSMYKAAIGGKQVLKKYAKCRHVEYENGKRVSEKEIMVPYEEEIYLPPNTTAAIYLLKHWGNKRGYTNDPLTLKIKQQELKLKKEAAENNNW